MEMVMPKISIITPIWCDISQKVDWLDEMIASVQAQTLTDWEIILIDDESPISLDNIKLKYAADRRLRWFDNAANVGPAKTRNTAVALAESNCILPLDSDDMLAHPEVLEHMYDTWLIDQTKIIYGNLQFLTQKAPNIFQRGQVVSLGQYTFELAMNLEGIMPVTAMHSKECHYAAGGWKAGELAPGLEDVEYWISAGERGYCGQKIDQVTLIYRRQENSRAYRLKHVNKNFRVMQEQIKKMHPEIYKGVFPMACCGKGKVSTQATDPAVLSRQNQSASRITPLEGYEEKDLEWVMYQGGRKARFDIAARGPANLPKSYTIFGTGHVFQIHKNHRKLFSDRQRLGFRMNQPDPRERAEVLSQPPIAPDVEIKDLPEPERSVIVRPDRIAVESGAVAVQTTAKFSPVPEATQIDSATDYQLSDLKLSPRITDLLAGDNVRLWTVEKLARTMPQILSAYPGIGIKTANTIIAKAQELLGQ
jgi:hypothetical protein